MLFTIFLPWRVEILQMTTINFEMATRNLSRSPFSDMTANVTWSTVYCRQSELYFRHFASGLPPLSPILVIPVAHNPLRVSRVPVYI